MRLLLRESKPALPAPPATRAGFVRPSAARWQGPKSAAFAAPQSAPRARRIRPPSFLPPPAAERWRSGLRDAARDRAIRAALPLLSRSGDERPRRARNRALRLLPRARAPAPP